MDAATVIATLGLGPHPEGGWYAETFRDDAGRGGEIGGRPVSTAIYFLLEEAQVSAWHRVLDAAEAWHFYAGAPLVLEMSDGMGPATITRLGTDLAGGERPQAVVPAGWWQRARALGAWTLVGCTVAPGFVFERFEMAPAGWEPPSA